MRSAAASFCSRLANASSLFRSCERWVRSLLRTTGPTRAIRRSRAHSGRLGLVATSNTTSILVFDVFACWPPGPPDAEARIVNSSIGMTTPGAGRITSATRRP